MIHNWLIKSKRFKISFFFLLLIFLASSGLWGYCVLDNSQSASEDEVYLNINQKIKENSREWEYNQQFFGGTATTFWEEQIRSSLPSAVFKNRELIYWTDNELVSLKFLHHSHPGVYYEHFKEGEFLIIIRESKGMIYQSFILLRSDSPFSSYYFNDKVNPLVSEVDVVFDVDEQQTAIALNDGFLKVEVKSNGGQSLLLMIGFVLMCFSSVLAGTILFYDVYERTRIERLSLIHI